jgi:hypothetical protein
MEELVSSKNVQPGGWGKFRILCIGYAFLCGKAKVDDMTPRAGPFHDLLALLRNTCADNNVELQDVEDARHDCGQHLNTSVVRDTGELYLS